MLAEIIVDVGLAAEATDQVAGVEAALLLLLGLAALAEGIGLRFLLGSRHVFAGL